MIRKNKAIAMIHEGRDLLICEFCTDHSKVDYDLIEDASFHFEERLGDSARERASFVFVDFFENNIEGYEVMDITNLSE